MSEQNDKEKGKQDRYAIYSVEKALDVIETLAEQESLSLIELTDLLHQPKSSLYRIILTLEKRGYIDRTEDDGKYCLGYKNLAITKKLLEKNSLRAVAMPVMQQLVDKYGDTVNLGVLSEGDVLYVEIVEGTHALRMKDTVGSRAPFHSTAMGKAITAFMREDEVEELIGRKPLYPVTANTMTEPEYFMSELHFIRKRGYAVDDEEMVEGARCIGAPIFDLYGKVAGAISLSGALHRFSREKWPEIGDDLVQAAQTISQRLGKTE